MPTYKIMYRETSPSLGAWFYWGDVTSSARTFGQRISGLTNGMTYEFAVGRKDPTTGYVSGWTYTKLATPFGTTTSSNDATIGVLNTDIDFTGSGTGVTTLRRESSKTILTLSANWEFVLIDYTGGKFGTKKTAGGSLPAGYSEDVTKVAKISNTHVDILVPASEQVVITVKPNGGSALNTITLTAIV